MRLRPFEPTDGPATLAIFRAAIRVTAAADYSPEQIEAWAGTDVTPEQWSAKRTATDTVVAEIDGRVAGFTDLDDSGHIDMLFVDPEQSRRGVATALLEWALTRARDLGIAEVNTHASLTARPFFEHHGFTVTRRQHPVIRGVEMTNFAMRRAVLRHRAEAHPRPTTP